MSQPRTIVRNVIYLAAGGLVTRLLMILAEMLVARRLGPSVFGDFSTAMAYTTIGSYFIMFGLDFHLVKAFSMTPGDRRWVLGNTFLLKAIYSVLVYSGLIVLASLLNYDSATIEMILILGAYNVLIAFQETFASVFQAAERMGRLGLYRSLQGILLVGLVFLWRDEGAAASSFAFLVPAVLISALWLRDTLRECSPQLRLDRVGFVFKESYMFGLAALFFMLNYRFDTVMLSWMRTTAEVGYYSAAYKFVDIFVKVPIIISIALMPALFRSVAREDRRDETIYRQSSRMMVLLGLPVIIVVSALNDTLIGMLFGAEYVPGAGALQILMWSLLLVFLTTPSTNLLNANSRHDLVLWAWFATFLINVTFNLFLIPRYGISGAAWATFASQTGLWIIVATLAKVTTGYSLPWRDFIKTTVSALAMMLVLVVLRDRVSFALCLLVSAAVYSGGLFLLRAFDEQDLSIARSLLSRK